MFSEDAVSCVVHAHACLASSVLAGGVNECSFFKRGKDMLILSRKKDESIVINNDIMVTVVEIRGDKVRLSIVAPKEVPVHRQEVYDAIHGLGGSPSEPVVSSSGADLHPSPEGLSEYARSVLGVGVSTRSPDLAAHVKNCLACRRALQSAIAAITL